MARDRAWASAMTTGPGSRRRASRRPRSVGEDPRLLDGLPREQRQVDLLLDERPRAQRAVARRSSRRRVIRPVARWTTAAACARSSDVTSSRASTASTLDCTTATGLRSSCETSSTRSRCAVNAASMRSSIPLIVPVRVRSSSSGPVSGMRRDRSVAEISRALAVIAPTGSQGPPGHPPADDEAQHEQGREPDDRVGAQGLQGRVVDVLLDVVDVGRLEVAAGAVPHRAAGALLELLDRHRVEGSRLDRAATGRGTPRRGASAATAKSRAE